MTNSVEDEIRPKVLVVEGDPRVRSALVEALGERFDVVGAAGSLEALALLEKTDDPQFAAVVADYKTPSGSGLDLMRAVEKRWPGVGTMLLTGHTSDPEITAARREGTLMVLYKPVEVSEVLMWVDHVVTASGMFKLLRSLRRNGSSTNVKSD